MTRDSVLGWILISVVGLSLFLSFAIWFRIPGEQSAEKEMGEQKSIDIMTVVSPAKILVHLGNASHTLFTPASSFYDKTWNYSRKTLSSVWSGGKAASIDLEADFFEQKTGLEVVFSTPMPVSFVKRLFNIESVDEANFDNTMLSSYSLIEDGGLWVYLKGSDGRYYKINKSGESGELSSLLKEVSESNPPLFATIPSSDAHVKISRGIYVPLMTQVLPQYGVKYEKVINDRLAVKFFDDFSVVREIRETDGAVIYTDGQRALRIYHDGTLEYSFPGIKEQKKNTSFYDALGTALDFINSHGGWPQGGFLSSYEISNQGINGNLYKFGFGIRINGCPIISDKEYMSVTVDGSQVKNYFRNMTGIDKPGRTADMISPIKAVDIAVSTKDIKAMEDIYLGYIMDKDEYIPTWVIRSQGHDIIIRSISE